MRKGGTGGNSTLTGAAFEYKTSLEQSLLNGEYKIVDRRDIGAKPKNDTAKIIVKEVWKDDVLKGYLLQKSALYRYLISQGIGWEKRISNRLFPDECFFNLEKNTFYIIEKKSQNGEGSVLEKLQTCYYKCLIYSRLFKDTNWNFKYCYLLDEWFEKTHDKHKDLYQFVKDNKCEYFFNELPLNFIGL